MVFLPQESNQLILYAREGVERRRREAGRGCVDTSQEVEVESRVQRDLALTLHSGRIVDITR